MTASELAFLGMGLLLGAATGAAIFVVLGSRLPRREIRVTVTPGAVPRRSETLSQDAFVTSPGEPARGGPGDRRWNARDGESSDTSTPVAVPGSAVAIPIEPRPGEGFELPPHRTIVPIGPGRPAGGDPRRTTPRPAISTTVPIGSGAAAIPAIDAALPAIAAVATIEEDAERELEQERRRGIRPSALERLLRGEHRAMVEVLDRIAGDDSQRRREWGLLLGGLVEAMADIAVRESVIDFPMGTAFWDTFTIEQCRRIVAALASMGYHYDGRDGWADSRVPGYRELTQAVADVGVEPRRIRAWPNSAQVATLLDGARPAPEDLLAAAGPAYHVEEMRELVGDHADELADLWLAWEAVRPALVEDHAPAT